MNFFSTRRQVNFGEGVDLGSNSIKNSTYTNFFLFDRINFTNQFRFQRPFLLQSNIIKGVLVDTIIPHTNIVSSQKPKVSKFNADPLFTWVFNHADFEYVHKNDLRRL